MGATAAIGGALQLGTGIYNAIDGNKRRKNAEEAIRNYKRQALNNAYANLGVSYLSSDLQSEEMQRQLATSTNALRGGGTRALVGSLPQLQQGQIQQSRQIGSDLDQQYIQNQQLEAQGNMKVQDMQEQREYEDLAGLGAEREAGKQQFSGALQGIGQSVTSAGIASLITGINPFSKTVSDTTGGGVLENSELQPLGTISQSVPSIANSPSLEMAQYKNYASNNIPRLINETTGTMMPNYVQQQSGNNQNYVQQQGYDNPFWGGINRLMFPYK